MEQSNLSKVMNTILTGGNNTVSLSDTSEVTIMVCNGESLPRLLNFAATVSEDLGLSLSDADGIKAKLLDKADDVSFILKLISKYTDDVYAVTGAMTSLGSAEAVKQLPIDDILNVLLRVIAVNRDFFMKRVLPIFKGGK